MHRTNVVEVDINILDVNTGKEDKARKLDRMVILETLNEIIKMI
jgi:hypothetical protein